MIASLPNTLIETAKQVLEVGLFESIMLMEDRIQFLKDRNPSISVEHDPLHIFSNPHEIIDHIADVGDPSKNKQHTQWILNQYKKQNIRQEDMSRVRTALTNFDKYKNKLDKKDINQYKTIGEVESAVHPHIGTAASKKEEVASLIHAGHTLVHDDNAGTKVYRLEPNEAGKRASQEIYGGGPEAGGKHTSWCTAARSEDCMFDHYSKDQPLHVIHTPSGKVYQAHPHSMQLMDAADERVEHNNPDAKYISKGLDHVPDGHVLKLNMRLPGVTTSDIVKGLEHPEIDIAESAAAHKNIVQSKDAMDKALTHHSAAVRGAYAVNGGIPKEHVDRLLKDDATTVRMWAASNPSNTTEHLREIFNNNKHQGSIADAVATHPNSNDSLLQHILSHAPSGQTRYFAVRNPNASEETLRNEIKSNPDSLRTMLTHPKLPDDLLSHALDRFNDYDDTYTRRTAVQHPNASRETIFKALNDKNSGVRAVTFKNPNITKEHIDYTLNTDGDDSVKSAVFSFTKPGKLSAEHISKGLEDESSTVRYSAAQRPELNNDHVKQILNSGHEHTLMGLYRNIHPSVSIDHKNDAAIKLREMGRPVKLLKHS